MDFYDGQPTTAYSGVNGGFRAGKRKRSHSQLKRKPRQAVTVYLRDYIDPDGTIRALGVDMVTYNRKEGN
jgi:hypothetical protein